jgi:hypothetical protein
MRFSAGSLKRKAAHRASYRDQVIKVACAARGWNAPLLHLRCAGPWRCALVTLLLDADT